MPTAWQELTASDICVVDQDAKVVRGRWDVTPAIHIHTELHRVRHDARVVIHNHPYYVCVLAALGRDHDNSFTRFVLAQSEQTKAKLLKLPFPDAVQKRLDAAAKQSVAEQQAVEAADAIPFEAFRQQYISADRLELTPTAVAAPALVAV